ncbi:MAG: LytR/AlgR family response regulator transcription factor [Bacteroidota bacterium]
MSKYRVLIIEDEKPAQKLLESFIAEYKNFAITGFCSDGYEGARMISAEKPDLVFLDVQMPRINGFEMLELIDENSAPLIIFTTAYDEFAIQAFNYNTCDYLLKPISRERFNKSIEKAEKRLESLGTNSPKIPIVSYANAPGKFLDRVVIRSGYQIAVVVCEDIVCLEAHDDYVMVHTEKDQYLKKQTMKFYEDNLNPDEFLRVHRSFIIRLNALSRIEPYSKDAFTAFLNNGLKVSVSKKGYDRLKEKLHF